MPPKQVTPRKVTKRAPSKSPIKTNLIKEADLKKQLLFLWACFKTTNAHVNIPAVAEQFNINTKAAQMRFTRLKKKLEDMEASEHDDASHVQPMTQVMPDSQVEQTLDFDENADADIEDGDQEDSKIKDEAEESL